MRLGLGMVAVAAMSAAAAIATAGPAAAWERDRAYADSFGNLVIESAAGYKRILVGEGREASRLSGYLAAGQENDVAYTDDAGYVEDTSGDEVVVSEGCYRPPVLVKGRSYMYGFDQGEIPLQGGPCR
jgi:hypothetical protein